MLFYEGRHFGDLNYYRIFPVRDICFDSHLHRSYEFFYVQEGALTLFLNEGRFELNSGDSALVLPNEIHGYTSQGHCTGYISIFSPDLVPAFTQAISGKTALNPVFRLDETTCDMFFNRLIKAKEDNTFYLKSCYYMLCSLYYSQVTLIDKKDDHRTLLNSALAYIDSHFAGTVSLKELARSMGYDYSYVSKYLRRHLGMPFSDYVNQHRIKRACYLLKNTSDSITAIALASGFDCIRSFNRAFFRYMETTPRSFRNEEASKEEGGPLRNKN